jgi:hypothetical protein
MAPSKKCKSTSSSAIQVKNRRKTISTEEKLSINLKHMNELLTYAIMLESPTAAHVHFVKKLTELKKVTSV